MHGFGVVAENLVFHPGERRLGTGLVEQHHQHDPLEVVEIDFLLIERHDPVQHQLALVGIEHVVLLKEHQETPAFAIQPVQLEVDEDPHRTPDPRLGQGRALALERVEPVEGFADFRGAETGLDQAVLEGVAIPNGIGVVVEVVFEEIEKYV